MAWTVSNNALSDIAAVGGVLYDNNAIVTAPKTINNNRTAKIVLTDYKFDLAPQLSGRDPDTGMLDEAFFTLVNNNEARLLIQGGYTTLEIYATYSPKPSFNYDEPKFDFVSSNHGVMYRNDSPLLSGESAVSGDVLTIRLESGYVFVGDVFISRRDPDTGMESLEYFNVNDSGDVATLTLNSGLWTGIYFEVEQVTPSVAGSNNVYVIDKSILSQVNVDRIVPNTVTGGFIDYGQFIVSVLEVPFTIPTDVVLEPEPIRLGSLNVSASAPKLATDRLVIDLGSISVDRQHNSLLDYSNATAILYLPRVPSVVLDLNQVMGGVVSIEYVLDCYTGDVDVNIRSSLAGGLIHSMRATIGVNVPFIHEGNTATSSNDNIQVGGNNGVSTPYIEIVKFDDLLVDGMFTAPVTVDDVLSSGSGYVEISSVKLDVSAPSDELDMLKGVLLGGIFI